MFRRKSAAAYLYSTVLLLPVDRYCTSCTGGMGRTRFPAPPDELATMGSDDGLAPLGRGAAWSRDLLLLGVAAGLAAWALRAATDAVVNRAIAGEFVPRRAVAVGGLGPSGAEPVVSARVAILRRAGWAHLAN